MRMLKMAALEEDLNCLTVWYCSGWIYLNHMGPFDKS